MKMKKYSKNILKSLMLVSMVFILLSGCADSKAASKDIDAYGVSFSDIDTLNGAVRRELSEGVKNSVLRARQMFEFRWTALSTIDAYYTESMDFVEGVEYQSVPYGQPVHTGSYVGFSSTMEEYAQAVNDAESKMYTEQGTYEYSETATKYSPFFSNDCSAYLSYIWDLPGRYTTSMFAEKTLRKTDTGYSDAMFQYVGTDINDIEVGYALNKGGSHIIFVYDVVYNEDSEIIQISTIEQTPPYIRLRVWGDGGNYGTLKDLQNMIDSSGYEIIRYTGIDKVTYKENPYVPLKVNKCVNNISLPISDTAYDKAASGEAFIDNGKYAIEGWTYNEKEIEKVQYSIDGGSWKDAAIEAYAGVTRFSAEESFDGKASLKICVKGVTSEGEYIIGDFTVSPMPKDYKYSVCFGDLCGEMYRPQQNILVETELSFDKPSESKISFSGWSMCSEKVISFEYKIDDGLWNYIETDFDGEIYKNFSDYTECNAYNTFKGGMSLGNLAEKTSGKLYIRCVTETNDVYDIAEISFSLGEETKAIFGQEVSSDTYDLIIIGIYALGAIIVLVVAFVIVRIILKKKKKAKLNGKAENDSEAENETAEESESSCNINGDDNSDVTDASAEKEQLDENK